MNVYRTRVASFEDTPGYTLQNADGRWWLRFFDSWLAEGVFIMRIATFDASPIRKSVYTLYVGMARMTRNIRDEWGFVYVLYPPLFVYFLERHPYISSFLMVFSFLQNYAR